jgi:hypothetical protein
MSVSGERKREREREKERETESERERERERERDLRSVSNKLLVSLSPDSHKILKLFGARD